MSGNLPVRLGTRRSDSTERTNAPPTVRTRLGRRGAIIGASTASPLRRRTPGLRPAYSLLTGVTPVMPATKADAVGRAERYRYAVQ